MFLGHREQVLVDARFQILNPAQEGPVLGDVLMSAVLLRHRATCVSPAQDTFYLSLMSPRCLSSPEAVRCPLAPFFKVWKMIILTVGSYNLPCETCPVLSETVGEGFDCP